MEADAIETIFKVIEKYPTEDSLCLNGLFSLMLLFRDGKQQQEESFMCNLMLFHGVLLLHR